MSVVFVLFENRSGYAKLYDDDDDQSETFFRTGGLGNQHNAAAAAAAGYSSDFTYSKISHFFVS